VKFSQFIADGIDLIRRKSRDQRSVSD